MRRARAGSRVRIAVAATALLLGACSTAKTLDEVAAGAEGMAVAPSPSGPAPSPATGTKPSPAASPSASPTASAAASPPASAAPTTTTDDPEALCALGNRLAAAGIVSFASKAFERALEHDEDLACAREGYQSALIARRESVVLAARAAAETKPGQSFRLYVAALARDYTNEDAYRELVAASKTFEGRPACRRARDAVDARLHAIANVLAAKGEGAVCGDVDASAELNAAAARLVLGKAGKRDGVAARDLYLTALEIDPSLAAKASVAGKLETVLPNPKGRPTIGRLLDRFVQWSEELYDGLDALAKVGLLLAFLVVILLTALTYVPGVTTVSRWLSRRRWDVSRPDDGDVVRARRVLAKVVLAPFRAAYRPKFEVPAPKKPGDA